MNYIALYRYSTEIGRYRDTVYTATVETFQLALYGHRSTHQLTRSISFVIQVIVQLPVIIYEVLCKLIIYGQLEPPVIARLVSTNGL